MLSNENLFPKDRMIDPQVHHHTVDRLIYEDFDEGPAWPLLALFAILLVNQCIGGWVMK